MKLYLANGQYVGTQADAKRIDKAFSQIDVPTDKDGLIMFLNAQAKPPVAVDTYAGVGGDGFDLLAPEPAPNLIDRLVEPRGYTAQFTPWESAADRVMTPADTDGLVQRIMGSKGYELKRYASAVAQAFSRLAGDK